MHLISDTLIEDDDSVLVVEPTFDENCFFAEVAGARVVGLRYDDEMQFPVDAVVRALQQPPKLCPRVLQIANPENPTGTLVQREGLRRILRAASRTLVLVDEAYFDFSGLTSSVDSPVSQSPGGANVLKIRRPRGVADRLLVRKA